MTSKRIAQVAQKVKDVDRELALLERRRQAAVNTLDRLAPAGNRAAQRPRNIFTTFPPD
jgi:hypothetical protein